LSQVEIGHIERQKIVAHIIGKVAIRTIHTAQVVKITSLAKHHGLIRVIEENRRFADEIDKAV
jgi:predicted transcriptional regulator